LRKDRAPERFYGLQGEDANTGVLRFAQDDGWGEVAFDDAIAVSLCCGEFVLRREGETDSFVPLRHFYSSLRQRVVLRLQSVLPVIAHPLSISLTFESETLHESAPF
jgi:hypothetical protein